MYCVPFARGKGLGVCSPIENLLFKLFNVPSVTNFRYFYRFLNPLLQLHMHAICLGLGGGGEAAGGKSRGEGATR